MMFGLIAFIWSLPLLLMIFAKKIARAHIAVREPDVKSTDAGYDEHLKRSTWVELIYLGIYLFIAWGMLLLAEFFIAADMVTDRFRFVPLLVVAAIGVSYATRSWILVADSRAKARRKVSQPTKDVV